MASEPPRSSDPFRRHYEVERELAARLRNSTRAERPALFATLYDELFERIPDHPRLTRRDAPEISRRKVLSQLRLLRPFLKPDTVFLEFAPGDCRLAAAVASQVRRAIGADISDQRTPGEASPPNLELIVYDGYELPVPDATADVIFSYQFLEHLHPDDVDGHFAMVRRLLKPGGVYVLTRRIGTPGRMMCRVTLAMNWSAFTSRNGPAVECGACWRGTGSPGSALSDSGSRFPAAF